GWRQPSASDGSLCVTLPLNLPRPSGDQHALLNGFAAIEQAVIVEIVKHGGVNHAALSERAPRQGDAASRIERKVEIESEGEVAVRRRFGRKRKRKRIEAQDVRQPRA